jgi:hypothetical protein
MRVYPEGREAADVVAVEANRAGADVVGPIFRFFLRN